MVPFLTKELSLEDAVGQLRQKASALVSSERRVDCRRIVTHMMSCQRLLPSQCFAFV